MKSSPPTMDCHRKQLGHFSSLKCAVILLLLIVCIVDASQLGNNAADKDKGKKSTAPVSTHEESPAQSDYNADHSGKLVATVVSPAEPPTQDHHNVDHSVTGPAAGESAKAEDKDEKSEARKEIKDAKDHSRPVEIHDDSGKQGDRWVLSTQCLDCLCRLATECDVHRQCEGRSCGPFAVSYVFWEDALDFKQPDGPSYEGKHGDIWKLSVQCLDCVCNLATGCDLQRQCEEPENEEGLEEGMDKGDCGPFHISFPFWADANHRKILPEGDAAMEAEWKECSLNLMCTTDLIQKYFNKYHVDCNGDGKVDCLDYAATHTQGPFGCKKRPFSRNRRKLMEDCLVTGQPGLYTTEYHKILLSLSDKGVKQE